MKVWVVFSDYGQDGVSEPYGIFSSKEKAQEWKASDDAKYYTSICIEEHVVDDPDAWKKTCE